jgi:hydroxymethylbilane synthase
VERRVITTSGDRFAGANAGGGAAQPPDPPGATPNVKAMFVKEIEEALLSGAVDLGVHSAKDLPADLPEGLCIAAYPEREDPRDVLIAGGMELESLPSGARIGTTSLRRRMQLSAARPDLDWVGLRGNVDTRLRKLGEGEVSALVLALAGLRRLGRLPERHQVLSTDLVVPAPGQGALALEARADRVEVLELLAPLDHAGTRLEVGLERAFLKAVGGGCSTPLGALARAEGGAASLTVFWSDPEGCRPVRLTGRAGPRPEELASLVESLRARVAAD